MFRSVVLLYICSPCLYLNTAGSSKYSISCNINTTVLHTETSDKIYLFFVFYKRNFSNRPNPVLTPTPLAVLG